MSANVQFEREIDWNGHNLSVWVINNGVRTLCIIPRATIHEVPLFGDALTREIGRDRVEIVARLRSAILGKIARNLGGPVKLRPQDLGGLILPSPGPFISEGANSP
jgi:hypothetical protein